MSALSASAQQKTLKGTVRDSVANKALEGATITVIREKDSILAAYTYARPDGAFAVSVSPGRYLLMASYPNYAEYSTPAIVDASGGTHELQPIYLKLKSRLLLEVIVKAKPVEVRIKGDTTEYNAQAFVIKPNSKVEDLLKQLPGIQVDHNGKITAFGQDVKHVLVDGEEFFGDDPTLVTRNLRGDMIDKVQLYDKKSDLEELTGMDDGKKDKTINLKLKDNKKNGYFGKLDAGQAPESYHQLQGMFNKFSEKSKVAVYGNKSTTGAVTLGGNDADRYGARGGTVEFVAGGLFLSGAKYDELSTSSGNYDGLGKPDALSGGVHYDTKWNYGKQSLNTNFKSGRLEVGGRQSTLTENDLSTTALISNSGQDFDKTISRNRLDAAYEYKPDTATRLKFSVDGLTRDMSSRSGYQVDIRDEQGRQLSTNNRTLSNEGSRQSVEMAGGFSRKLRHPGRSVSLDFFSSNSQIKTDGYLNATSRLMDQAGEATIEQIDQLKKDRLVEKVVSGTFGFSEGITSKLTALFTYGIGSSENKVLRNSFNRSDEGQYQEFLPQLSADFLLKQFSNQAGLKFNYRLKKHKIDIGNNTSLVNYKQYDRTAGSMLYRTFITWNPQISYDYRIKNIGMFNIEYTGSNIMPSASQLQPLQTNDDPLNIVTGNPGLTPAYQHYFGVYFNTYVPTTGSRIYLISYYNRTNNPMINTLNVDEFGKARYQPVNLPGHSNELFSIRTSYGRKVTKLEVYFGPDFDFRYEKTYGLVNGVLQTRSVQQYSGGIGAGKHTSKFYLRSGLSAFYNHTSSNLDNLLSNNGGGIKGYLSSGIDLPANLSLEADLDYQANQKTEAFPDDVQIFTINTSISKKFLKSQALQAKLAVNDLLNQNQGFQRLLVGTMMTQNTYTTIQRYFLFSLSWDFSKFGKKP